jgi:glutathione S-transferase
MPIQIIGTYLSPFVRKVLVTLHLKSIPYQLDPLIPFLGNMKFTSFSPLRIVPILINNDFSITDSSVICQYLEDKYPSPSIYPKNIED